MQQQPIALSDDALDVLMRLTAPIELELRDAFLHAVAAELRRCQPGAIGPGLIFRTAKALLCDFTGTASPKYR